MTQTTATLPLEAGMWTLDLPHCTLGFVARHMGISKVRGQFRTFDAKVEVGTDLATTRIAATVDLNSVDTGNADRDAHLRSRDFFSADLHPAMTFESTNITHVEGENYRVEGDLTINGMTRQETLNLVFQGLETFPGDGSVHAGFEAKGTINRMDYGVDFNVPLGVEGLVVSDRIEIDLDIQLLAP